MLVICNNLELKSEGSLSGEKAIVIIGTNVNSNVLLFNTWLLCLPVLGNMQYIAYDYGFYLKTS